jgi:hypothetical protein
VECRGLVPDGADAIETDDVAGGRRCILIVAEPSNYMPRGVRLNFFRTAIVAGANGVDMCENARVVSPVT